MANHVGAYTVIRSIGTGRWVLGWTDTNHHWHEVADYATEARALSAAARLTAEPVAYLDRG